MITNVGGIDKHKSILLIGISMSNKYLYEVVRPETFAEMDEVFDTCVLNKSYRLIFDMGLDLGKVYLMNIENKHGYLKVADLLKHYDFTYVVPLDIHMSDSFFDPMNNGRQTYYIQYLLQKSGDMHTVYLITDVHASLYKDIDAFLDDMSDKRERFKANQLTNEAFENVIFVANSVSDIDYANVPLAAYLTYADINEYPYCPYKMTTVFDFDQTDSVGDMAYFKYHVNGATTIENLLDMISTENDPLKIFFIYRICLYISKELDYANFIGSLYTTYRKKLIEDYVENFLTSLRGFLLIDFKILGLEAFADAYHPGTIRYKIRPIGCVNNFVVRTAIM